MKALTQFPSVLDNLAKNLSWTSALGEAYHTQAADVMSAIQVLRAKAQAAGNLKSGSQIVVVQQSPQIIVIQSANPQVVYVPVYNPAVVYGYPYVYSRIRYAPPPAATAVVAFGVGIAVGAMMSGGYGWGYSSWNCGWHGTTRGVSRRGVLRKHRLARWLLRFRRSTAASRTMAPAITHPPGRMHVVARSRTATAAQAPVKRTTQGPGRPPRRCKVPMPMGAMEPRRFRRTVTLPTASIKRPLKEPQVRCTLRTVARLMARRVSTATAPPWVRPQMATSMRPRTATPTRTPGAVGAETRITPQKSSASGLGRAGKERRIIGLQRSRRRRLGIQVGECSRFGKQGRRWPLGESATGAADKRLSGE